MLRFSASSNYNPYVVQRAPTSCVYLDSDMTPAQVVPVVQLYSQTRTSKVTGTSFEINAMRNGIRICNPDKGEKRTAGIDEGVKQSVADSFEEIARRKGIRVSSPSTMKEEKHGRVEQNMNVIRIGEYKNMKYEYEEEAVKQGVIASFEELAKRNGIRIASPSNLENERRASLKDGMVSPSLNPNAVVFPGPNALLQPSQTCSERSCVEICSIETLDSSGTGEEFAHRDAQVECLKACNSKLIDVVENLTKNLEAMEKKISSLSQESEDLKEQLKLCIEKNSRKNYIDECIETEHDYWPERLPNETLSNSSTVASSPDSGVELMSGTRSNEVYERSTLPTAHHEEINCAKEPPVAVETKTHLSSAYVSISGENKMSTILSGDTVTGDEIYHSDSDDMNSVSKRTQGTATNDERASMLVGKDANTSKANYCLINQSGDPKQVVETLTSSLPSSTSSTPAVVNSQTINTVTAKQHNDVPLRSVDLTNNNNPSPPKSPLDEIDVLAKHLGFGENWHQRILRTCSALSAMSMAPSQPPLAAAPNQDLGRFPLSSPGLLPAFCPTYEKSIGAPGKDTLAKSSLQKLMTRLTEKYPSKSRGDLIECLKKAKISFGDQGFRKKTLTEILNRVDEVAQMEQQTK